MNVHQLHFALLRLEENESHPLCQNPILNQLLIKLNLATHHHCLWLLFVVTLGRYDNRAISHGWKVPPDHNLLEVAYLSELAKAATTVWLP